MACRLAGWPGLRREWSWGSGRVTAWGSACTYDAAGAARASVHSRGLAAVKRGWMGANGSLTCVWPVDTFSFRPVGT